MSAAVVTRASWIHDSIHADGEGGKGRVDLLKININLRRCSPGSSSIPGTLEAINPELTSRALRTRPLSASNVTYSSSKLNQPQDSLHATNATAPVVKSSKCYVITREW